VARPVRGQARGDGETVHPGQGTSTDTESL